MGLITSRIGPKLTMEETEGNASRGLVTAALQGHEASENVGPSFTEERKVIRTITGAKGGVVSMINHKVIMSDSASQSILLERHEVCHEDLMKGLRPTPYKPNPYVPNVTQ